MGLFLLSGGTTPEPAPEPTPSVPTYAVTLTAYNAVPEQTDDTPFETASGAYSNPEVIAARSSNLASALPFGTIIAVEGPSAAQNTCGFGVVAPLIGYRVIADAMNPRYTDRIDVLFDTQSNYTLAGGREENAGTILGICRGVTIRVVGHVNINRIPKTQAELAALVGGNSKALAVK